MTSLPDRPIASRRGPVCLARPNTSSAGRPIPPRQGPVGPPTPRLPASLLQQSRSFSELPSHGEAALRRRTRPARRRGKAESGWEGPGRRRRLRAAERAPRGGRSEVWSCHGLSRGPRPFITRAQEGKRGSGDPVRASLGSEGRRAESCGPFSLPGPERSAGRPGV